MAGGADTCYEGEVCLISFIAPIVPNLLPARVDSTTDRVLGAHPTPPARSASPLPPNVPTGPRNQNKYKDRDNNAQAVDGLDYGGGGGGGGGGGFGGMDRGSATPADFDDRNGR